MLKQIKQKLSSFKKKEFALNHEHESRHRFYDVSYDLKIDEECLNEGADKVDFRSSDYRCIDYWQNVIDAINTETFIDLECGFDPYLQISNWILERADNVMEDEIKEETEIKPVCLAAVLLATQKFPYQIEQHLRMSFAPKMFSYPGLFATEDPAIQKLWGDVLTTVPDIYWLSKLIAVTSKYPSIAKIIDQINENIADDIPVHVSYDELSDDDQLAFKAFARISPMIK